MYMHAYWLVYMHVYALASAEKKRKQNEDAEVTFFCGLKLAAMAIPNMTAMADWVD